MRTSSRPTLSQALRSRYWRRADAEIVLTAWRASGQSLRAFARKRGVSEHRLRRWEKGLEAPALPQFHPIEIVMDPGAQAPEAPEPLELLLPGGRRVSVPAAFDPDHLKRLVEAVESWSC